MNAAHQKDLFRHNAHEVIVDASYLPPGATLEEAFSGGAPTVEIRGSAAGAPLTGLGPVGLTEGPPGTLRKTFTPAQIDAATSSVADDALVYQVVIFSGLAEVVTPLCVRNPRYAQ